MTPRIGHGIDAHRFIPGRHLMLGGILIPFAGIKLIDLALVAGHLV